MMRERCIQCCTAFLPDPLHRSPPAATSISPSASSIGWPPSTRSDHAEDHVVPPGGMNLSESLPLSQHVGLTYAYHACIMSMLGWRSRGNRYGDRAVAIARDFNDFWELGECCSYIGIGLYASARYEEGLVQLLRAIELFDKAGDLWELNLAHFHKGCCHFGLGDLAEAVAEARWTFAASVRLGDSRTMCSSYLRRGPRGAISRSRSCRAASRAAGRRHVHRARHDGRGALAFLPRPDRGGPRDVRAGLRNCHGERCA